jgi:ABC-type maltose transport system permease subunit
MITDFLIDYFNAIMNTLILILCMFVLYMFMAHDMGYAWSEFKVFVKTLANLNIQEIISDAISKAGI